MKWLLVVCLLFLISCQSVATTSSAFPSPTTPLSNTLPTLTPFPLNDPQLLQAKELLKEAMEQQDAAKLERVISVTKWVASIYRQGGTPPIDPRRALNLALEFAKENKLVVDLQRTTYEPLWSVPAGDTSVLVRVMPPQGDAYYAHLYLAHEPSSWRFTGILTRIPYYDAPSVAQLRAAPSKYVGKEYMYVGSYDGKASSTQVGAPPTSNAFLLNTFSGPIWVLLKNEPYVPSLPANANSKIGQLMRVFGTVTLKDGAPYLLSDSAEFIDSNSWMHVQGTIDSVNPTTRQVKLKTEGSGVSLLSLTQTSFISLPNGTPGALSELNAGQTIDATGVPQKDGSLIVEELFLAP
ncbi:MAG TPA: hypothetical protein VFD70_27435 [Anaerolineae bacterium]|nr:hypothetical protein [Anaerolineae bacterium]